MGAARAPPDVDHSPSLSFGQNERYPVEPLPEWHQSMNVNNKRDYRLQKIIEKHPPELNTLVCLKECITERDNMTM
jgi:hypothetical protein